MSRVISILCIFFSICQLSIGIWEAVMAASNVPGNGNSKLNVQNQEIYGFTITKAVCNIMSGISLLFTGSLLCFIEPNNDKSSESGKNGIFQFICFGTSIWGLVRVFNQEFCNELTIDYNNVLLVEMIYFFSLISLVVFGSCFGCCYVCYYYNKKDNDIQIKSVKSGPIGLDITNTSEFSV